MDITIYGFVFVSFWTFLCGCHLRCKPFLERAGKEENTTLAETCIFFCFNVLFEVFEIFISSYRKKTKLPNKFF